MVVCGSRELVADVFGRDLCIACGACVSLCPYMRSHLGRTAVLFTCEQRKGRCHAFCPKVEVDLDELCESMYGAAFSADPLGHYRSIHLARAGRAMTADAFQAGGTVSSIICHALATGTADAAIVTGREGIMPEPRIATTAAEVVQCAGSKYTAAPVVEWYHRAVADGYRRIAVVATPCQALALALIRQNPTDAGDFADTTSLVAGLFCTWSLDYRLFRHLIGEAHNQSDIRKFDIPPPPSEVMEITTSSGVARIPLADIRGCIPHSCEYCFDMTAEFADVSVGVLEGRNDLNMLIVRTRRGEDAVDAAVRDGYLEIMDPEQEALERLGAAARSKKKRALSRAHNEGLINTGKDRRSLVRLARETLEKILS